MIMFIQVSMETSRQELCSQLEEKDRTITRLQQDITKLEVINEQICRITRMFCEHQTYANFASVSIRISKIAKPKLVLVNTHDPCQNTIVRSQKGQFLC